MANTVSNKVICPYCDRNCRLYRGSELFPLRISLRDRHYWYCFMCDALCECHGLTTVPRGTAAKPELRDLRRVARQWMKNVQEKHNWTGAALRRWLTDVTGIDPARFDVDSLRDHDVQRITDICKAQAILYDKYGVEAKARLLPSDFE